MNYYKAFDAGSSIYLVAFIIDYIIELFSINSSGIKITALGLKIITNMNEHSLNTTFSLTWRVLISYLIFILFFMSAFYFFKKIKKTDDYMIM